MRTAALRLQPHLSSTICHRLTCPLCHFDCQPRTTCLARRSSLARCAPLLGAEGVGKWHTVEQQCQGHVPSWPAANTGWPFNLLCGTPVVQVSSTVLELQRLLPRARFVYCSATGVSEVGCLQLVGLD